MDHCYWTSMLASKPRGTLYIGVTNDIIGRVEQHRAGTASAFTRKYQVHRLVWYEMHCDIRVAIQREKTMKEWPRAWKVNLIERENLHWTDLFPSRPGVRAIPKDWHLKAELPETPVTGRKRRAENDA